jgi:hypothetical protein
MLSVLWPCKENIDKRLLYLTHAKIWTDFGISNFPSKPNPDDVVLRAPFSIEHPSGI